ncbi:MAG: phosphoribosylanthranilate isomerase, partial [Thermoanaerobaculales bacterium]|nr:phosphoribosylanthranilate isomerase [Thermoanaerobaculales bacterium]
RTEKKPQARFMLVKICGIRRPEDAVIAAAAGADMVGFVFVPGTSRAVEPREVEWVREFSGAQTVGVFRNAELGRMIEIKDQLNLNWVQLHGDEPDDWIRILGRGVIRRLPIPSAGIDRERVKEVFLMGARVLVDPGAGDGRWCDWADLGHRLEGLSFGLAGGLNPENVKEAVREARPDWVDVSSGVEAAPGVKDPDRIRRFVSEAGLSFMV